MSFLLNDLRYAVRYLLRAPAFSIVAIATLALAIGANTAIFTVVDAVLLRPLPYAHADRLVMVWESNPPTTERGVSAFEARNVVSPANFLVWRDENTVFDGMAAFFEQPANISGAGEPERIAVQYVTPNLFSLAGIYPRLGRPFTTEEGEPGRDRVAILSYGLWQRQFGGLAGAIGSTIRLSGIPFTVVGVMPRGFQLFIKHESIVTDPPQLWLPLAFSAADHQPRGRYMMAMARLKAGVALETAQTQMNRISAGLAKKFPDFDTGWGVDLVPMRQELTGDVRPALLLLFAAVGFVLLIACANVANLLLARAAARDREIAVRTALGAGRSRLLRQLLTESVLIGLAGGAFGVLLAYWGAAALVALSPKGLLDLTGIHINGQVLAFTAGISILTGIVFGLAPALGTAKVDVQEALKEGGRGTTGGRSRHRASNLFVVAEVALALVLVAGAGLLIRSLGSLENVNPGFNPNHLLTAELLLPESKHGKPADIIAFYNGFLARIRQIPRVRDASGDVFLPFTGIGAATDFTIVGRPAPPRGQSWTTEVHTTLGDYFRTMQIPLLRGRTFSQAEETEERHVVLINQALARLYFPDQNPLGRQIIIDMKDENVPSTIIGVVGDVHDHGLEQAPQPAVYWPIPELPYSIMTFAIRADGAPLGLAPALRAQLAALDPELPLADVRTMDDWLGDSLGRARFGAALLGLFAAIALLLAAVGIYSVMAYAVAERTHEIGIRVALGADRSDVLRMVLRRGALLAFVGVGVGLAGALALTRFLQSLLYQVKPADPLTFAAGAALLVAVALAACCIPAWRAMRVDPMVALRQE